MRFRYKPSQTGGTNRKENPDGARTTDSCIQVTARSSPVNKNWRSHRESKHSSETSVVSSQTGTCISSRLKCTGAEKVPIPSDFYIHDQ
jgi:hypothetical protein